MLLKAASIWNTKKVVTHHRDSKSWIGLYLKGGSGSGGEGVLGILGVSVWVVPEVGVLGVYNGSKGASGKGETTGDGLYR